MNQCLRELFGDQARVQRFLDNIPLAFQIVQLEMPGNPAVGMLREQIIIAYFIDELGSSKVSVPEVGNKVGSDVTICQQELSIKTATRPKTSKSIASIAGSIKTSWTVDWEKVEESMEKYKPEIDLLLVAIAWGKEEESVFYIPLEIQSQVFDNLGIEKYLNVYTGTNSRSITLTKEALDGLVTHPETSKHKINWENQDLNHTPYDRWEKFWRETANQ